MSKRERGERRQELRAVVMERSQGRCEWPQCGQPATESAHIHSIGMGGRASADDPLNAFAACFSHARISDGEYGSGSSPQYEQSHLDLLGDAYVGLPRHLIAWTRAEALRRLVGP